MTVRQQWIVVLAIVGLLGGGLFAATRLLGDELFPVTVGSKAPEFAAATVDATPVRKTLGDYQGKVILLNVWATWCVPCVVEMPSIQKLHEQFADRGLQVIAVSVDDAGAEEKIRNFLVEHRLTFLVLHEPTGAIQRAYQTTGVPETFVIGADGVIRKKVIGISDWSSEANRALIAQLLGVPAEPTAGDAPAASEVPIDTTGSATR
jgi:cytochrome c biogenesis protein CcmG/thiol:disulfide interchange protein DsbE